LVQTTLKALDYLLWITNYSPGVLITARCYAERGYATLCRPSVRLSQTVCDV